MLFSKQEGLFYQSSFRMNSFTHETFTAIVSSMVIITGTLSPLAVEVSQQQVESIPQPDPVVVELSSYLQSRGSEMPAEVLVKYDNWPMIVAVGVAESGLRHESGRFNLWGIKYFGPKTGINRNGRYRNYESWEEAIAHASQVLYKYDPADGQPKPEAMVRRWKTIPPFNRWTNTVRAGLTEVRVQVPSAPEDFIKI